MLKRCFEIIDVEEIRTMPKFIHNVVINENSELPDAGVAWMVKNRHPKYLLKAIIVVKTVGATTMIWIGVMTNLIRGQNLMVNKCHG